MTLLAHLIGQVGASSHGREEWMSVDAPEAFIAALPKSDVRGRYANPYKANPYKDGYIFGKESRGLGYYNLKTREAYNVIVKRTKAKIGDPSEKVKGIVAIVVISTAFAVIIAVASDRSMMENLSILIVIPTTLLRALFYIFDMRSKNKNDEVVKEVAILRRNAAGPSASLNLPAQLQERLNKMSGSSQTSNDSPAYYGGASACGVSPYTYTALGGGAGEAGEGGDEDCAGACGGYEGHEGRGGACGGGGHVDGTIAHGFW
jgi:hypothetical protein